MARTGATFADAAAEYLRYIEHDREAQAVHRAGLPLGNRGSSAASVRIDAAGVGDEPRPSSAGSRRSTALLGRATS
jgi:hypothetical protein